jgi:hypothetical protein
MSAEEIIKQLGLKPHPEGGFYRETFRSNKLIDGYNLGTAIYFLITADNVSNFHRIRQDELWFHHYGESVDIHILEDGKHKILPLGLLTSEALPYQLVPKNTIFGSSLAQNSSGFALVSCVVIPGFEFSDFELFSYEDLIQEFPNCAEIIEKLTPNEMRHG